MHLLTSHSIRSESIMNLFRISLTVTSLALLTGGVCLAQAGPGGDSKPPGAVPPPPAGEEAPISAASGPAPIIEAAGRNPRC